MRRDYISKVAWVPTNIRKYTQENVESIGGRIVEKYLSHEAAKHIAFILNSETKAQQGNYIALVD